MRKNLNVLLETSLQVLKEKTASKETLKTAMFKASVIQLCIDLELQLNDIRLSGSNEQINQGDLVEVAFKAYKSINNKGSLSSSTVDTKIEGCNFEIKTQYISKANASKIASKKAIIFFNKGLDLYGSVVTRDTLYNNYTKDKRLAHSIKKCESIEDLPTIANEFIEDINYYINEFKNLLD